MHGDQSAQCPGLALKADDAAGEGGISCVIGRRSGGDAAADGVGVAVDPVLLVRREPGIGAEFFEGLDTGIQLANPNG